MFAKPVEAILFDMDGLLIDTEALYIRAMQRAAQTLGRDMPISFCHSMIGVPSRECDVLIQDFYGPAFSLAEFRGHYATAIKLLLEDGIPVKAGAVELLDFLAARGLPAAVATSSRRVTAEHHLGRAGLLGRFEAVTTIDDVVRAKPHPDIYLEAARRLGIQPMHCIAFEDSNIGLTAAHAAGTMAIMVPDILPPLAAVRAKCVTVVPDLHAARRLLESAI